MAKEACWDNSWIPEWDENRKPFEGWAARTWNWYYIDGLNHELPPDQIGMRLTEEETKSYLKALAWLKKERADNPGIPICYDLCELE